MLHVNVDQPTTNDPISLAGTASLGKYGYGNGIAVMERISGTVLIWAKIRKGLAEYNLGFA